MNQDLQQQNSQPMNAEEDEWEDVEDDEEDDG